jgi:hypothetical protein
MKCGYNKCFFNGEVEKENAIKHGNRYYHPECLKQMQEKDEVRKLYLEKVNPTEVVKILNSTINNIVHIKKVSSEYLLFALKYAINNNIQINAPMGLHYIINNYKIKKAFEEAYIKKRLNEIKNNMQQTNHCEEEIKIDYKNDSVNLWDKITGQR